MDDDELFLQSDGKNVIKYTLEKKDKELIDEFYRLIELYPERKSILYYMLGEHHMLSFKEDGHYQKAIEAYKQLLALENPKENHKELAIANLANAYDALGDVDNAIKYFEMGFNEYPDTYENNLELKNKLMERYNNFLKMKKNEKI